MKTNPLKEGSLTENSAGIGSVTRKMLRERAVELALIDGRMAQHASKSDWEQARRELTGQPEPDSKETAMESAPESERWDPLPGSAGRKAWEASSEDTDDDGRSDSARLVEEGISEAGHDQMLQAAEAEEKQDQKEKEPSSKT
jgi:hypothetical protein